MTDIPPKIVCHENNPSERREGRQFSRRHWFFERLGRLWLALLVCLFACRQISHYLGSSQRVTPNALEMIFFFLPYIFLVKGHRPSCSNTSVSINAICHPERSSSLFLISPILWWRKDFLDIKTRTIKPMQPQHYSQSRGSSGARPRTRKIHQLEFVACQYNPALSMAKWTIRLPKAFHFICLCIFPCSSIKNFLMIKVLVADRGRDGPHGIAKADRRAHYRRQIHGGAIPIFVNHRCSGVYLIKIYLMPAIQSACS